MKEVTCDIDQFAVGLQELLSDIVPSVEDQLSKEIPKLARKGAKRLQKEAASHWNGKTGERYSGGFSSKKTSSGAITTAEIGNAEVPGLVHLLEKGHATLTARRVPGIPHVAPVYDELEPEVIKAVEKAVGRALEG